MVILELLVGSDLILSINTFDMAESLFEDCRSYLEPHTEAMLKYLMFNGSDVIIDGY